MVYQGCALGGGLRAEGRCFLTLLRLTLELDLKLERGIGWGCLLGFSPCLESTASSVHSLPPGSAHSSSGRRHLLPLGSPGGFLCEGCFSGSWELSVRGRRESESCD